MFFKQLAAVGLMPSAVSVLGQDQPATKAFPFTRDQYGRMQISVALTDANGVVQSLPFLFDTGASISVLYRLASYGLDLKTQIRKQRRIFSATGPVESLIYAIGSMQVLGREVGPLDLPAVPHAGTLDAFGLIGTDLMLNESLLVRRDAMDIQQRASDTPLPEDMHILDSRPVIRNSFSASLLVGGFDIPAVLDTGASNTTFNLPALEMLRDRGLNLFGRDGGKISAGGLEVDAVAYDLDGLALGGRRMPWRQVAMGAATIYMAPLRVFRRLGASRIPAAIVGMDLLSRQDLLFDFKNRRFALSGDFSIAK